MGNGFFVKGLLIQTHIYAHRGFSGSCPENTALAFDQAIHMGADGIETDLQWLKDGIVVLFHDRHLKKLGDEEKKLSDMNYEDICKLDYLHSEFKNEKVMTFQHCIEDFARLTSFVFEVKSTIEKNTLEMQKRLDQLNQNIKALRKNYLKFEYYCSSFSQNVLDGMRRSTKLNYLIKNFRSKDSVEDTISDMEEHSWLIGCCVSIKCLNQDLRNYTTKKNKLLAVYTCNSKEEILKALNHNVDILMTDVPGYAMKLRG